MVSAPWRRALPFTSFPPTTSNTHRHSALSAASALVARWLTLVPALLHVASTKCVRIPVWRRCTRNRLRFSILRSWTLLGRRVRVALWGLTLRSSGQSPEYRCLPLNSNVRLARMQHTQVLAGSSKFGGPRSVSKSGVESLPCPRRPSSAALRRGLFRSLRWCHWFQLVAWSVGPSSHWPSRSIAPHGTVGAFGFGQGHTASASAGEPNPSFKRTSTGVPVSAA